MSFLLQFLKIFEEVIILIKTITLSN